MLIEWGDVFVIQSNSDPILAKIKKLEEFWRENGVGIGLYNECVLWWGVRFERLLAALKSKRHKQAQNCYVSGASVRWAFGMINASGPGIPTTYGSHFLA